MRLFTQKDLDRLLVVDGGVHLETVPESLTKVPWGDYVLNKNGLYRYGHLWSTPLPREFSINMAFKDRKPK